MSGKDEAILDFGSEKITLMVGGKDVNNSLNIKASYATNYDGFVDGEFLNPSALAEDIQNVVDGMQKSCGFKITSLTIGVPTEFCFSTCKTVTQTFERPKKISKQDVANLVQSARPQVEGHMPIGEGAIYFVLGETNKTQNPVGMVDSKLTACVSYLFVQNGFVDVVSKAIIMTGIEKFLFVSSAFAEGLYLFDDDQREKYVILVDCGHITTSVSLHRGRGILNLTSFSMGSGHIVADLCSLLKIPFSSAQELYKKIVLCIEPSEDDFYEILVDKKVVPISMKVANAIVECRIEVIAKGILKAFNLWEYNFPDFIPLSLTGGGLSFTKGAKDVLAKFVGKNVEVTKMLYSQYNKPSYASSVAMLSYALDNKQNFLGGRF